MLRAVGASRYSMGCQLSRSVGARATVWVLAVEIRGCQSLLRSSHIRAVGASRYYVAPSAPPVTEISSSRRVEPWVPELLRSSHVRSVGASRYCVAPTYDPRVPVATA